MSQVEGLRRKNPFDVIVKARNLATYTIKICDNEKIFLPEHRDTTRLIRETATEIYLLLSQANVISIRANDTHRDEHLAKRRELKERAISNCEKLRALIELAHSLYHLKSTRVKYWSALVHDESDLIRAWMVNEK